MIDFIIHYEYFNQKYLYVFKKLVFLFCFFFFTLEHRFDINS